VKKRASANYFWIGNSLQEKSRFYVSLATFCSRRKYRNICKYDRALESAKL